MSDSIKKDDPCTGPQMIIQKPRAEPVLAVSIFEIFKVLKLDSFLGSSPSDPESAKTLFFIPFLSDRASLMCD